MKTEKVMRLLLTAFWLMSMTLLPTACEELSKEGSVINEVVPGTWSFTYDIQGDVSFSFSYEYVIFRDDGTCAITYPDGELKGTYQAGDGFILIESDGTINAKPMMWRILEFSPYQLSAEYVLELEEQDVLITIWLEKVSGNL